MNLFEKQFQDTIHFLQFEDYDLALKRIIDLTLDTEELSFYKKTCELLRWVDYNESNTDGKKEKYSVILNELYQLLSKKEISKPKILLEANNVKKSYSQSAFSLGPISLKISEGQIVGLVGENGNGKTSLLRLLCGELDATEGSISYMLDYEDRYELRTKLIYIPQRPNIWYGSILDNLQFTASSYNIKGEKNELMVDLIISRMGLRNYRNMNWKNLSSGYKMKFELARMLLRKPKLLLIDEPLANLDILSQQTVLEDFKAIAKSPFRPLGIVVSSQQLYEVEKNSDQVIFLKYGEQKNLKSEEANKKEIAELIIEFESEWSQKQLHAALSKISLIKLQYNGSSYIAYFPNTIFLNNFLTIIIDDNIPIKYFRNISDSTRRFFI
ncbi:ABC-2 type transport system ATP-binding protein [Apibacter mensalis]|uniref:ABC-2 type transport system ATP-binding protein n=1 Tax=Apibacter mensalis TaxID=1586267 RepID=A0A0X3AR70_9FLAO|nr:ABC transporter ATP-binding protein [Apibacter mensalis]CVK16876.1 ABC-2 type transport system ATP-binding protein [Apibacter mensalis]